MYTQEPLFERKRITSDTAVKAASGRVRRVLVTNADTPIDGLLQIYDNDSEASGTVLLDVVISAEQGTVDLDFSNIGGIEAADGIFADLTGSGVIAHIWYE